MGWIFTTSLEHAIISKCAKGEDSFHIFHVDFGALRHSQSLLIEQPVPSQSSQEGSTDLEDGSPLINLDYLSHPAVSQNYTKPWKDTEIHMTYLSHRLKPQNPSTLKTKATVFAACPASESRCDGSQPLTSPRGEWWRCISWDVPSGNQSMDWFNWKSTGNHRFSQ